MTQPTQPPLVNDYNANLTLDQAAELLKQCDGPITVITHAKPDGDAAGSLVALVTALNAIGKQATGLLVPPILPSLDFLAHSHGIRIADPDHGIPKDTAQLVIVDTGAYSQLHPLPEQVEGMLDRTLILDHHLSGDVPAKDKYIDVTAAAAAEIVASLVDKLVDRSTIGSQATQTINDALFTGIASDTGWFRFSNVTPNTHRLAADLIAAGVDHAGLYARLEQAERPEKLKLLIRAVDSLELLADDRAAVMTLHATDFDETGARAEETERLIDIPQQVGTIQVIALLSEIHTDHGPQTRVSFRSKPLPDAVNVAELAQQFGGGGHARAAGAKIDAPLSDVRPRIVAALTQAVTASATA
ncbi:MAG: DHH family phosphoesterase [Phycisphaeraceae bacterium]